MQQNLKTLHGDFVHPFARMLPLFRYQSQVYRIGESGPPLGLEGYTPRWEVVNAVLGARQTVQVRVDLNNDYCLLATLGSASLNTVGGFRVQIRDQRRKLRLADRGLEFPCMGGNSASPYFTREPYPFGGPRPQALVILQNLEANQNTVQFVMYGVITPFEGTIHDGK